jgi:hypothetical protein
MRAPGGASGGGRVKRRVAACLLVGGVMAAAPAAFGQGGSADRREDEARKECLAGRTQRGIDLLAELFTETRDPNYIFNQARCFQQNNRPDEATGRFREYLRKAKALTPEERLEVETHIAECEAMKGREIAVANDTAGIVVDTTVRERIDQNAHQRATRLRTVGLVTTGAGLVAVAFGAAMGLWTRSLESRFEERHPPGSTTFDRSAFTEGQRIENLQWVGYAVGGLAIGTGVVFYYLGTRERQAPARVALIPLVGRQVGAGVDWRF